MRIGSARWATLVFASLPMAAPADEPRGLVVELEEVHKIADRAAGFSEPSGLALASDGTGYWSVSDDTARIFRLDLRGNLEPDLSSALGMKGLEGVAEDAARNRLLVVREDSAEIVSVSLFDGSATTYPITRMAGFAGIAARFGSVQSNNGLEGITLDTDADEVIVVRENGPRLLIRISADLSTILGAVELTEARGFACDGDDDVGLDLSDLTFDEAREAFWILSDEGSCVFFYDPIAATATGLSLAGSVEHPKRRLKNPEGIALNPEGTKLQIVTDDGKESRMAVFAIKAVADGQPEDP